MKHIMTKYRIAAAAIVASLATACSHGINFDIEGQLVDNAASEVYLIVEKTSADTLATAAVGSDNRFRITAMPTSPPRPSSATTTATRSPRCSWRRTP